MGILQCKIQFEAIANRRRATMNIHVPYVGKLGEVKDTKC